MARDGTSRLYEVDEDLVVYKKPKLMGFSGIFGYLTCDLVTLQRSEITLKRRKPQILSETNYKGKKQPRINTDAHGFVEIELLSVFIRGSSS